MVQMFVQELQTAEHGSLMALPENNPRLGVMEKATKRGGATYKHSMTPTLKSVFMRDESRVINGLECGYLAFERFGYLQFTLDQKQFQPSPYFPKTVVGHACVTFMILVGLDSDWARGPTYIINYWAGYESKTSPIYE